MLCRCSFLSPAACVFPNGVGAAAIQPLNVVLTHTTADFDTLAAAVGLAKLWQDERPDDGENYNKTPIMNT